MTKKERALLAVQTLESVYPQATCALQYEKPYELLIAVRLSAQCTDARVNLITPKLFSAYPTLESLAAADIQDLEEELTISKDSGADTTTAMALQRGDWARDIFTTARPWPPKVLGL